MLFEFVKNPTTYFHVKPRPNMPQVLTKGWKHGFVTLPDVKLHYVEADNNSSKPLMLMLHGFPEFWYSWRHQIEAFKNDYRVVAIDMRGYGQSDKPSGMENYTISKLAADVKNVVRALGYESCILVAHDWGGAVAWQTTLLYPKVVNKLVIFNCPHPKAFAEYLKGGSIKQMLKSWYMFFFQFPYLPEIFIRSNDFQFFNDIFTNAEAGGCRNPTAFSDEDIEAWKYTYSQPGAMTPPIDYYRASMRRLDSLYKTQAGKSQEVQPPTLIVWGTADIALEKGMGDLSINYCKDGRIRYVEGASHWVQQDEPEKCCKYMKEFLKETSK